MKSTRLLFFVGLAFMLTHCGSKDTRPRRGEVLFLGDTTSTTVKGEYANREAHITSEYASILGVKLFRSGINLSYTTDLNDLNTENLDKYDGLIIYSKHESLSNDQESALRSFVKNGKGIVALNNAAASFANSEWYINALGAKMVSGKDGSFTAAIVQSSSPITQGIQPFQTWNEIYEFSNVNADKTVLTERVEGTTHEPYTWIRNEGKGRIFYTAYGRNDSTWTNLNFQNMLRNAVKWAIGEQVNKQIADLNIPDVSVYAGVDTITDPRKPHMLKGPQKPLTPEESLKLTQLPPGFEIQLFASEPDIVKPMAMAWDERGRLWIAETIDFPSDFTREDGVASDRIKICEDTDGDGKADKFTIFADSLNIPTALTFADGGIFVGQAPDLIFLKDTNGDDKADIRKIVATGWSKEDTHGGLGSFQYGLDNRIWGTTGMAGFTGTIEGKKYQFGPSVISIGTNGTGFRYHASTNDNTFGLGFTEDNNAFVSTANSGHSKFYSMPESEDDQHFTGGPYGMGDVSGVQYIATHFESHIATPNYRQVDCVGGFTSATNHHFYTARSFPKEYWNRIAFVNDPTIHVIHKAIIEPDGAGFKEKDGWNLLESSDEFEGAFQTEVGPDGALWVADFYSFIYQHFGFGNDEVSIGRVVPYEGKPLEGGKGSAFKSPLRDKTRGRIYRIVYKDAKKYTPMKLSKKDVPGLVKALENDNMFWRLTAQRLLIELQDRSVIPDLIKIAANQDVDEIGLNSPAIHALWTLHGLGAMDGSNKEALEVAKKDLAHKASGVRKAAVEVLPKNQQSVQIIAASGIANDADLNVRLTVFRVLNDFPPSEEISNLVYKASQDEKNSKDKWLSKIMLNLSVKNQGAFIEASKKGTTGAPELLTNRITNVLRNISYLISSRTEKDFNPTVAGLGISLTGRIALIKDFLKKKYVSRGLIAAQGNKENGYGLYFVNGKLTFTVFQDGKEYQASAKLISPDRINSEVSAMLDKDGSMIIKYDSIIVAKGKAPGLFKSNLTVPLRLKEDLEGTNRIVSYADSSDFGQYYDPYFTLRIITFNSGESAAAVASKIPPGAPYATINIKVVKEAMKYDNKLITVKAGKKILIKLENPDGMQHNMVIVKPGSLDKLGGAADALARTADAAKQNYVPDIPEVLFSTKLVNPHETYELIFMAPSEPGDYPYACTFPGHWKMMNGILRVTK